ncbi:hypothetical protein CP556_25125 [Natrinema sp. CBA1119]|nr:hypothetical protein CP556_25125 [Natrinema sp. CBA1119]
MNGGDAGAEDTDAVLHQAAMTPNRRGRDNGHEPGSTDTQPDWEQIARREKATQIETALENIVEEPVYDLSQAVTDGEEVRDAYHGVVARISEYVTLAEADLEEIGELDASSGDDYVLSQAIDAASCMTSGNREAARQKLEYALSRLDALEEDADER